MRFDLLRRWLLSGLLLIAFPALALDVDIDGVSDELANNIRLHLSAWDTLPGSEVDDVRETLDPAVKRALRALGYYRPTVDYSLSGNDLQLTIDPGEPVRWGEVDIQVAYSDNKSPDNKSPDNNNPDNNPGSTAPDTVLQQTIETHPFANGQVLNHKTYEDFKLRLQTVMAERGYLDAKITSSQLRIDPASNIADISMRLQAGQRYRIAAIHYSDSKVEPALLSNIARLPETGDWYSANIVGDVYNRLNDSGYFSRVSIRVEKQPPDRADIQVELADQPSHLISTGIGVGTDIKGLRYRVNWRMPILNARGDSLSSEIKITKIEQELFSEYRIPWHHPLDQYININAGWQHKDNEDLELEVLKTGVSYNRILPGGWQYSYHLDLERERSTLGDNPTESYTYVIPNVQLSRRRFTGEAADPRRGYKVFMGLGVSREFIGSSKDFDRFNIGANAVYTFASKHSLAARGEFGLIKTDDVLLIPASQRYFAGGDQSVRGYAYETISPLDLDGNISGGQYLNVASLEYRYEFIKNWKLALFADSGRVYRDMPEPGPDDPAVRQQWRDIIEESKKFKTGVGTGIRWKTPIGLLAFDVAVPLDSEEDNFRIHFFLGSSL